MSNNKKNSLDISSKNIKDNETWNTCPVCLKSWKGKVAIPGLLHRTRICENCRLKEK